MKTRVLFVITAFNDGGAESIVKDYCVNINRNLFDPAVLLIYNRNDTSNAKQINSNQIKCYSVYKRWTYVEKFIHRIFGSILIKKKYKRIINTFKPDVIHVHQGNLSYLQSCGELLRNKRLFYTCHSVPYRYFKKESELRAAKFLITKYGMRMIALHNEMKEILNNMFDVSNSLVVYNGIDFNKFNVVKESVEELRMKYGIPKDAFVVGHVGRFHPVKNHLFLVEIFNELCKIKSNAFLFLIGDGELKKTIIEKLKSYSLYDRALILSNRTDIPQIVKSMDVLTLPSQLEGFPVSVIEAQAVGKKCLISDRINQECVLTKNVVTLSIDRVSDWVEELLKSYDYQYTKEDISKIKSFDIKSIIKFVEHIYSE